VTTIGLASLICALPDTELLAAEVAVTVTRGGVGTRFGAVYSPLALIVPTPAPATPLTLQLRPVFVVPVTVAVNCAVAEVKTVVAEGLTVTVITGGVTVVELVELAAAGAVPPQDVIKLVEAAADNRTRPIPNVRTFIPRPQQSRDVGAAALVGRLPVNI
jgi:hypothetical protein